MKEQEIVGFFGTTGHETEFDGMTYPWLLREFVTRAYKGKSFGVILQAFANKISKKLAVPGMKLSIRQARGSNAYILASRYVSDSDNIRVIVGKDASFAEIIEGLHHEVKHSEQEYLLHKFLYHGVVPKDDYQKAMLLSLIFEQIKELEKREGIDDYDAYYRSFPEFDAHIFAMMEVQKLMQKYEIFDNFDLQLITRECMYKMLSVYCYDREGMENPIIQEDIRDFEDNVRRAKRGDFGAKVQDFVSRIADKDFCVQKAYGRIVDVLDRMAAQTILEDAFLKSKGVSVNLFDGQHLIYDDEEDWDNPVPGIPEWGIDEEGILGAAIDEHLVGGQKFDELVLNLEKLFGEMI